MQVPNMHWDYIAILILLAIVIPWRSTARIRSLLYSAEFASAQRMALYLSTMVFQWALAGIILWRSAVRGLSEAQLGLDIPNVQRAIAVTICCQWSSCSTKSSESNVWREFRLESAE